MSFETWHAFLVAAVLVSVSPGAVAVACMAIGMHRGCRLGKVILVILILRLHKSGTEHGEAD
jgi:threonine/homoserine/homoserine lactone efflux protein